MTSQLCDRRLVKVQETLQTIGYDNRAIVANYDFAVPGNQETLNKVDLAAFSDPFRHDLHTSCIAAERVPFETDIQATLHRLSYLATPVALILQADGVDIWPVTRTPVPRPFEHVSYDRLSHFFFDHARDFRPDSLVEAKTKGHQLTFLDFDHTLLEFARDATQRILVEQFEAAVDTARRSASEREDLVAADLTKAVLQILAAAILEDKLLLGEEKSSTVEDLIHRSSRQYGQYFDLSTLYQIGHDVGQATFDTLRHNVTFRSFTNEMLGYFYENTFVDKDLRRDLGIYYTPRSIAKRILNRLPIEDIPPSDRIIFDGSSGSGNLLLAAFERLGDLLPRAWGRKQRHDYLVQRIHGVDVDQFATQVAGLSLFFIDLPEGDAWNIKAADFLKPAAAILPSQPTIVVGNPPFKEPRSSRGRREQRASLFLDKYLDLLGPDGLLAIVLPETFLENPSCRDSRRRLLEECDILEMWQLPEGIFPMSNVATVVVIAKKHGAKCKSMGGPVRIERVGALSKERKQFLSGDNPRISHVVPSTSSWINESDSRVFSSPLERGVWDVIGASRRLRDVALIRNGIIPGKNQRVSHFNQARLDTGWRPWLKGTKQLEPYTLKSIPKNYVKYPGRLQWPRTDLESVFESPRAKVLVNSARAPGNPWRIFAAIDDFGYFPSQSFHCLIPQDHSTSLEELVAFLNSPIASAWIDSRNRKRWIDERTLGDMPFPIFAGRAREQIISYVGEIMASKKQIAIDRFGRESAINAIRELSHCIDELVYDTLGMCGEGRDMLRKLFAGFRRPGLEWLGFNQATETSVVSSIVRKWPVTGQVVQMDVVNNAITMWVRGYNESQPFRIPIPATMPGWALRPHTAFEAEVPWLVRNSRQPEANDLTNFRPLDFSYSQPEELVALLENPEELDELYQ